MDEEQVKRLTDLLLEQLPLGVILADRNGDMVYINKTAEKIRHIQRENLLGKNVLQCHQEQSQPNVAKALTHIFLKPETVYRRMVDDSANGKYYINTYASVADENNQSVGMAVLTEDVTEKRKLELQRASTYQMLEETTNSIRLKYHDLLVTAMESIAKLLEMRDSYTLNHSVNVCRYAQKMYEFRFGIDQGYQTVRTASSLHDIGKVGVPDDILHKPGKLTAEEYTIIRRHPVIAETILKPLDSGSELSNIVRHHHERYDGLGYPDGLAGKDIPIASRLIALADAYDAMHSDRPYRKGLPDEKCVDEIIACNGTQFDPEWVEVFLELVKTGSF